MGSGKRGDEGLEKIASVWFTNPHCDTAGESSGTDSKGETVQKWERKWGNGEEEVHRDGNCEGYILKHLHE